MAILKQDMQLALSMGRNRFITSWDKFSMLMDAFNGSGWLQASLRPGEDTGMDVTFSVPALGMEVQMEFYKRGRNVVLRKAHMKPKRKGSLYNHLDRIVRGTPGRIIHELKSTWITLKPWKEAWRRQRHRSFGGRCKIRHDRQ